MFKAAIKREQSQACLSYAEHEQARPQINGQWSILGGNPMDWPALSAGYLPSISVASLMQGQRYNIPVAVHECFADFFHFLRFFLNLLTPSWSFGSFGHLSKSETDAVKNRHYNINILFIYSEQ